MSDPTIPQLRLVRETARTRTIVASMGALDFTFNTRTRVLELTLGGVNGETYRLEASHAPAIALRAFLDAVEIPS